VAEDLRDYGIRGAVLQRLRSGGAVIQEVPVSKAIAPTQKEPPFAIAQIVLVLLVVLTILAVKRFRTEPLTVATSSVKAA
jgi:hypothetical protein